MQRYAGAAKLRIRQESRRRLLSHYTDHVITCYSAAVPRNRPRRAAGEERDKMEDAITQFLQFLTVEKGASPNTVAAYRNDIQQFAAFVQSSRAPGSRLSWAAVDR